MEIEVTRNEVRKDWDPKFGPDLCDKDLEKHSVRTAALEKRPGEGILSISIDVGDELGQLFVNTQFEAMPGDYASCQTGQNRVLVQGGGWLKEILEQISTEDAEWNLQILSRPCPHAPVDPTVEHARKVLLGQQTVQEALNEIDGTRGDDPGAGPAPKVETEVKN